MYHHKILRKIYTQVDFKNIHALIIAVISTNKSEHVKVNWYGVIDANGEAENNINIVWCTSFPCKTQEDVVLDGNKLASSDLLFNVICKHPRRHKSRFYVEPCKGQETVTISTSTVYIPSIDIKVWTQKSELPQANFLRFLT